MNTHPTERGTTMRTLTMTAAATSLAAAAVLVPAVPTAAGTCSSYGCGGFYHIAPDDGFDDPIRVACDWNNVWNTSRMIAEGQRSPCADTDGFYVAPGTKVLCRAAWSGWYAYTHTGGWTKVYDGHTPECVVQIA